MKPWSVVFMVTYNRIAKYLIAGAIATGVDLGLLWFFTSKLSIWYLYSAIAAFVVALGVSFSLQKFWVFRDHSLESMHVQAILHASLGLVNTLANTFFMFMLVSVLGAHYLLAQILSGGIIAIGSFFMYKKVIFTKGL